MFIGRPRNIMLAAATVIALGAWTAPNAEPAPATPGATGATKSDLPTAEQIMIDAVKALGGREAIEKIRTVRSTMVMNAQGMTIQTEMSWSRSGGRLTKATLPMGQMEAGSDGKISWMKGPMGYSIVTEAEARQMNEQSELFMNMLEPQRVAKESTTAVQNAGKQTVAGKECYRLHYTGKDISDERNVFYDIDGGLPVAFEIVEKMAGGEATTRMIFSDWKDEQAVKFFRTISIESSEEPGAAMTLKIEKLEVNTLDDAAFAAPEEVKKLAAAKPANSGGSGNSGNSGGAGDAGGAKEIKLEDLTAEQQASAREMLRAPKESGNVKAMKQMVAQLEPALPNLPAERRPTMQYVVQELKKEIARLGGGS